MAQKITFILGIGGTLAITISLFFACWFFAAAFSRVHIFVSNQSGITVSNLVISGSCKTRHTDRLAALAEWRTSTPYDSDGAMRFSFDCAGVSYRTNTGLARGFLGVFYTISSNMTVRIVKKS